ncbi:MAG: tRNA 2-thiouridine(34) synthase MnmA [Anaerolineales bacterium]|nr:tRNA 2-thiouridine(34) synthase MnmA [Anaerolineae bacterium]PWB53063.1 MAG: tRNA 2-thiouridine(34) synthase MnmA [Anaerolineales bacterium]
MTTKPTVVVAMSGGVDSSVAAALLVEQGYRVIGMMLRLWSEPEAESANRCCSPDAMAMARRIAAILSIPFYVLDAREYFFKEVVQPFIDDYAHNLTPNPCINCNRLIRWEFLFKHALSVGADFLATGHYARIHQLPDQTYQLLRGVDLSKDQSYVLHVLSQNHLRHTMFPLGEMVKSEVRSLAHRFNLPVAEKADSQDLCFLGADRNYHAFLARHAPQSLNPGLIVDLQGITLGYHQGLPLYTIGQRKGLKIANPTPLYVIKKDAIKNVLFVGREDALGCRSLRTIKTNWINGNPPDAPLECQVKVRYKARDAAGVVNKTDADSFQMDFNNPIRDITPGQAAVLYNGEVCLGGGIIVDENKNQLVEE